MLFLAHPVWLLGLIPWIALSLYLLTARPRLVVVPFLELWPRSQPASERHASWHVPPPAVIAALAAALLAIVAAAGPAIGRGDGTGARDVVVIVDRGFTMSGGGEGSRRFQRLADESAGSIVQSLGANLARMIVVPGDQERQINLADLAGEVSRLSPAAVDSTAALRDAVGRALLDPQALVLVLSDKVMNVSDQRVIRISPQDKLQNVGISELSVRMLAGGKACAMVRLVNDSSFSHASLRVTGAEAVSVALPASGGAANYFVNLPASPAVVEAWVEPGGDIDADDRAWAVRGPAWPKVTPRCLLSMELQRMVDVYLRDRPAGPESRDVSVLPLDSAGSSDQAAALVMTDGIAAKPAPSEAVQSEPGPLTSGVDWNAAMDGADIAIAQPGSGWRRIVWQKDRTLMAVRMQPQREIWIGFRNRAWAATPGFVMFWSNAFDWLGEGDDCYRSERAGPPNNLWPGLYTRNGHAIAVNAAGGAIPPVAATDWRGALSGLGNRAAGERMEMSPWVLLAAMGCLAIAAVYVHVPAAYDYGMAEVELLFLGTGTSTGVPMIGCHCAVCDSTDPRERTRPSVVISSGGVRVLVDVTPELRLQCVANRVDAIDAVVLTHAHADHIMGLDDLRRFNSIKNGPLDIWSDDRTHATVTRCFGYAFAAPDPAVKLFRPQLVRRPIEGPFEIGPMRWTPIKLLHGEMPVLGFRVGRAAYCTDVNRIPDESYALLEDLDVLVLDALTRNRHATHFSLDQAVEEAGKIKAKQTYFTHVAHGLGHEATCAGLPAGVSLAYDGLVAAARLES